MKKREILLVIAVIAFGIIYNSVKSGDFRFSDGCSPDYRELLDKKYPVDFPQKEIQYIFKESDAAPVRKIKINNPAGDIEVGKSSDNNIRITPVIRVYHKDKRKAGAIAGEIRLMTREIGEKIAIDAMANDRFPYHRVRLGFKCLIPTNVELHLINRYGNIDINDAGQNIIVDEKHGDLFIKNVTSPLMVKTNDGLVRLYDIKGPLQLDSSHSQVKIRNIPSLKLKCSHADIYMADIKEGIEITRAGYSDIEIENSGPVNIDAKLTKMKLVNIKGGVVVANSHESISMTDIQGDIDIKTRQCRIDITKAVGDYLVIKNSYNDVNIDGFSGKSLGALLDHGKLNVTFENIAERITIKTGYADVTLNYPGSVQPAFSINSVNGKILNSTSARLTVREDREKRSLNSPAGKPRIIIDATYADVFLKNITNLPAEAE